MNNTTIYMYNNTHDLFLQTLQSHYCPAVSQLMKELLDPANAHSKLETPLGKYLDIDSDQIFQDSCTELSNNVALNFTEADKLWQEHV